MSRQRRSITQIAIDNLIFKVPHRKKRKPEVRPSDIKTFAYTDHLHDVKWQRLRARRKHE